MDAVEIDPKILALGRSRHPEHPYDDPRVAAHLTDARAFMKRTTARDDLILFVGGLLENLSLIIGMKALLLVAAVLYSLAALSFFGLPSRRAAASISPALKQP